MLVCMPGIESVCYAAQTPAAHPLNNITTAGLSIFKIIYTFSNITNLLSICIYGTLPVKLSKRYRRHYRTAYAYPFGESNQLS